jgi:hypothetical protein
MKFIEPMWIKTTIISWIGTVTGMGFGLADAKDEIQAWALLIGGIIIPILSLAFHIYKTLNKKD